MAVLDLYVPNEGKEAALNALFGQTNWTLGSIGVAVLRIELIKATATLSPSLAYGSLTVADFSGYGPVTRTTGWGTATTSGDKGVSVNTAAAFVHNGGATPNNIEGVVYSFLPSSGSRRILAIALYPSPVSMSNNGDTITVTPRLTADYDPSPG